MCGICGVYNHGTGRPADPGLVEAMTRSMTHRGPDDEGFHLDGDLGLGMRRLSIIDLAGGAQPMSGEDGSVVVVQNGEIYNFRELRRELEGRGHRFRTRSDTEVIVHGYEQWGLDVLGRLNGMFGIAIWDSADRRLVLARDPFGVKPLHYWHDGSELLFGSEVRCLLRAPQVRRAVDRSSLRLFLELSFVPSPRTIFEGVSKLLPGHALVCERGGVRHERFHRRVPRIRRIAPRQAVAEVREAVVGAVRRQMVADVPVGALMSGGVDSGAVAAIMTEAAGGPIDTFTVGFGAGYAKDELPAARLTAGRIGSRHHELIISPDDYLGWMPGCIGHLEEPVAYWSTVAFWKISELARATVKVVLTGQGADEPFGGYSRYLGERYGWAYRAVPGPARRALIDPAVERLPRNERLKRAIRSLGTRDPAHRYRRIASIIDESLALELFPPEALPDDGWRMEPWLADVPHLDGTSRMLYADARTLLADALLIYGDKLSMAASLEARVPFLDLELMELAESLPPSLKIRRGRRKWVLKEALAPWTAPETRRQPKIGFDVPVDEWFRGELRGQLEERLLGEGSACREHFRADTLRRMIDEHAQGRHDHKRSLFSLLTFEMWHERFIAPPSWPAPAVARPAATARGAA
jgi:asparagine synthase (glutamine-hydrolysing)